MHQDPRVKPGALSQSTTLKTESDSASVTDPSSSPTTHGSPEPQDHGTSSNQPYVAIKVLVSNSASGLIIGRSGQTISELQAKSHARIKLSQGGDYYPGTSDRICLVQGALSCVKVAIELVLAKLYELQSLQQVSTQVTEQSADNEPSQQVIQPPPVFIIRVLMPSACCGMVIGRGGSNIKELKEKSRVSFIQLSPKEHEVLVGHGATLSTNERIMTITGPTFATCTSCVRSILDDFSTNLEISRYVNMTTNYGRMLQSSHSSYVAVVPPPPPGYYIESPGSPQRFMQPRYQPHAHHHHYEEQVSLNVSPSALGQSFTSHSSGHYPPPQQYGSSPGSIRAQFWSPDTSVHSSHSRRSSGISRSDSNPSIEQLAQTFQSQSLHRGHPMMSAPATLPPMEQVVSRLGIPDYR